MAIQRVLEAAEYIARDKPGAAHAWAESTLHAVEQLADSPESGRMVAEIGRREVRELIHGSYRIVYRIEAEQILIVTVRHGSRRFDRREVE